MRNLFFALGIFFNSLSLGQATGSCSDLVSVLGQIPAQAILAAKQSGSLTVKTFERDGRYVVLVSSPPDQAWDAENVHAIATHSKLFASENEWREGIGNSIAKRFPKLASDEFMRRDAGDSIGEMAHSLRDSIRSVASQLREHLDTNHELELDEVSEIDIASPDKTMTMKGQFTQRELIKSADSFEASSRELDALIESRIPPAPEGQTRIALEKGHRVGLREHLLSLYLHTKIDRFFLNQYLAIPGLIRDNVVLQFMLPVMIPHPAAQYFYASAIATILLDLASDFWTQPDSFGYAPDQALAQPRSRTITKNILKAMDAHPDQPALVALVTHVLSENISQLLEDEGYTEIP